MVEGWQKLKDTADYLGISPDTLYKLAQNGEIPAAKVGTQWRFKREDIDGWMKGRYPALFAGGSKPKPVSGQRLLRG